MRFLGDMGVSFRVVEWLRTTGHDAVHVREIGMGRSFDAKILELARAENRIVLTFDLDFGDLMAVSSEPATPVIIFRLNNTRVANVIARLESVLAKSAADLEAPCVIIVEDSRHRVRSFN